MALIMGVTRRDALWTAATGGLVAVDVAHADEKTPARSGVEPLTDADRGRLEEGGPVVTKTFIAALRERLSDKEAAKLRAFIAPRYLKGHDLQEGEFPIQRVVTGDTRRRGAAGFRSVSEIAAVNRCDAELVSLAGAAVVVWSDREPGVRRLLELVKAKGILLHVIGTGSETRLT